MSNKIERSYLPLEVTEFRAETEGDKNFITGYAAVYNQPTDKMGFREVVKPGAFTRALKEKQDVRVLFNHDPSAILGRSTSGTATLSEDNKGLKFRCEMPDTTTGRDVMTSIKRGDISQCSFGFRAVKQAWVNSTDPNDKTKMIATRELHDVDLGDVSPVTYPAYDGTSVGASRSYTGMEVRAYFPDGIPEDVNEHISIEVRSDELRPINAEGQPTPTEQKSDEVSEETRERMKMQLVLSESSMN
jgi:HK97 family phage prohead protease